MKQGFGTILHPEQESYLERMLPPRDGILREMEALEEDHWWFRGKRLLLQALLARTGEGDKKMILDLKVGDLVKITDGPFKEYDGKISEVNEEKGSIKVLVPIFGRDTAVELDSLQVRKV